MNINGKEFNPSEYDDLKTITIDGNDFNVDDLIEQLHTICHAAVINYGSSSQLHQLSEECCELGAVASGLARNREEKFLDVCEEIADVEVMLEQAKIILNAKTDPLGYPSADEIIAYLKAYKLKRLSDKLNEHIATLARKRIPRTSENT